MFEVETRERAQPERRQELLLVKHSREQSFEPRFVDQTDQLAGLAVREQFREGAALRSVVHKPPGARAKIGQRLPQRGIEPDGCEDRQQSDHGAGADDHRLPVRFPQPVVEKAIFLVPKLVHRRGDRCEVLEEFESDVLIRRIVIGEDERDFKHVEAIFRHPGGGVGLLEDFAPGQQFRSIERPDIVEAKEAAFKYVVARGVVPIDPPGEINQELLECPRQKIEVGAAVDFEDRQRGPGVNSAD